MSEFSEADAQRIADHGRDALLERLRPAFHETARQHADVLQLEEAQLEEMIERAVDRADGLQWRRALAAVATEELGMSLSEALTAPVVARAQELAGAPSYEAALAELGLEQVRGESADGEVRTAISEAPGSEPEPSVTAEPEPEAALQAQAEDPIEFEAEDAAAEGEGSGSTEDEANGSMEGEGSGSTEDEANGTTEDEAHGSMEGEGNGTAEDEAEEDSAEFDAGPDDAPPQVLRLAAIHLGGIATLEAGEPNLELRIGAPGVDIARRRGRVLGRLRWREIRALEASPPRGLRRRRRQDRAQLAVRTQHGNATFEIPQLSSDELTAQLAPLLERYARR